MESKLNDWNLEGISRNRLKNQFGQPLPFPTCDKNTPFCLSRFTANGSREWVLCSSWHVIEAAACWQYYETLFSGENQQLSLRHSYSAISSEPVTEFILQNKQWTVHIVIATTVVVVDFFFFRFCLAIVLFHSEWVCKCVCESINESHETQFKAHYHFESYYCYFFWSVGNFFSLFACKFTCWLRFKERAKSQNQH